MLQLGHKSSDVYQQAVQLVKNIYQVTGLFPDTERAVLVYTMRRQAVLLCQELATALTKKGKKQRRQFQLCLDRCVALDAQLELAAAVHLVPEAQLHDASNHLDAIYKRLTALLKEP